MSLVLFCFLGAFLLTYITLPRTIRIAKRLGLVDKPDSRKSHTSRIPTMGGVSIFIGVLLISLVAIPFGEYQEFGFILAALIIVFLLGAVDDVDPILPISKLMGQMLAVLLVVVFADIRVSSLYGIFGIEMISYELSLLISFTVLIFLINSFNLIDGINGLSSSITILVASVLGIWFYMIGSLPYAVVSAAVAGSSLAFLKFNVTPARIFMGDTGSLVLGTICAVLTVQFLETSAYTASFGVIGKAAPSVAFGLLIVPIFDTTRVFFLRLLRGRSPFLPDKNHIHHLLIAAGFSHMQSTAMLLGVNVLFIMAAFQFQDVRPIIFFVVSFSIAIILTQVLQISILLRKRRIYTS